MKAVPTWVLYTILRVLMFAAPLTILLALAIEPWLSTLLAAVIGFCLSYIFLRAPREDVARSLYAARHRSTPRVGQDDETEDAALDDAERRTAAGAGVAGAHPLESEGERRAQQDAIGEPGEAGEFQGKNQLG
jgi:hypothetical protein